MPNKRTIPRVCETCGRDFLARPTDVKVGRGRFCGQDCVIRVTFEKRRLSLVDEIKRTGRIPLHSRGGSIRAYAIVDLEDAEWASQWSWSFGSGYVLRTARASDGARRPIYLHRELLGLPRICDGVVADHINRDRLDNRRANLRIATPTQNGQNIPVRGGTSKHRGVSFNKAARSRPWRVQMRINGNKHTIGYFRTEEEAAQAAREARQHFMPFANN